MELVTGATGRTGYWTLLASEFSAWPDPGFEPDESIARAIRREFDPDFALLWVRRIYRDPGGNVVKRGYHHIARHVRYPDRLGKVDAQPINGLVKPLHGWPSSFNEGRIYEVETLEGPGNAGIYPTEYRPVEMKLYHDFKRQWYEVRVKADGVKQRARAGSIGQIESRETNLQKVEQTAKMKARDDRRQLLKAAEKDLAGELAPPPPGPKVSVVVPAGSTPAKES